MAFPIGPILGGWLLTQLLVGLGVPAQRAGDRARPGRRRRPDARVRCAQRPAWTWPGWRPRPPAWWSLTYGLIKAGQDGWGNLCALALMVGGVALLVGFFAWERRLTRRPAASPWSTSACSPRPRSPGAWSWPWCRSWPCLGILFTMPQYFQGVLGTDAMGSGLRLLPLVAGLMIGPSPRPGSSRVVGAKVAVAAGFILLAVGLFVGALISVGSSGLFVASWMVVAGLGTGSPWPPPCPPRWSNCRRRRAGSVRRAAGGQQDRGSARHRRPRQRAQRRLPRPSRLVGSAGDGGRGGGRQSVFGGVAVAHKLHSPALLRSVDAAFVHGMDLALLVSAAIAVAGAVLTVLFLPQVNASVEEKMRPASQAGRSCRPRPATIGTAA